MSLTSSSALQRSRRAGFVWFLPLGLLVVAALVANLGISPVGKAQAATDSVVVTATVPSSLSVADQCSGAYAITVTLGGYNDGTPCAVQFGSTNDASVTLRAKRPAGGAFFSSIFADAGGTCEDLGTVDEAGLKVVSVGANVTNAWGCALGADNANNTTAHKGITTTEANVCTTGATGTTLECTLGVGVFEAGSDAAPAAPTGTLNLDVIA